MLEGVFHCQPSQIPFSFSCPVRVCGCVGVWVYGCVGVWVCGCVGVWVCGCVGVWVCQCVGVLVCQCVGVSVCQCVGVSVCQCVGVLVKTPIFLKITLTGLRLVVGAYLFQRILSYFILF